ncbi:uncharacterized protein LOC117124903 isoform X2 [Anneissia japonica]|uniref:uncharacterized protein LOC117124903 isoform X2 n=1 Tax=Anneissia japonica TaxID=1529436 RepID=UPI0014254BB5|nr:uncharacterized protein LOC117124903 isoform X2 [Anneissia japonica]
MGEYRCVLLATVLKVHNSIPFYPYCKRCYTKLVFDSKKKIWKCSQCSNRMKDVDVTYRFRLSMSVADRRGVADVCIFGQCLNNIFGSTADNFQKYLQHIEVSHPDIDANLLLQSAETNTITGNQFYFGFKVACKTGINIKGLDDLVVHHSEDHMPRSIVACQAIQPFQSSQHLTVIQYLKHWIHCLSKTTITDSCSAALCCCHNNHGIDDRKQSLRKSSTFICSGSSTESNSQRKLATNSLVLSYEESLQASNSQGIHSQPLTVSVDAIEHSRRESLQSLREFNESETVWEDGFHSCSSKNCAENLIDSFMHINNFTNHEDNKPVRQIEDNQSKIISSNSIRTCQQNSTSSVKSNESTTFPDDLPFSEDLELFLERVDARHAEGNIGSSSGSMNARELSLKVKIEDCAEHHSVANPAKSTETLQTPLGETLDNDVSEIREPNNLRNQTYLSELPFPEDFESFVQHLESKNEGETADSCKRSPLCTHGNVIDSSNEENLSKLQCRRDPNRSLKRQVANNLTHISAGIVHETLQTCRFSTPIQVPIRTGFRKNCKRRLQHQLKTDLPTDRPRRNSHCNTSNTEKEASHKKLLKHASCPQNSVLGDTTDRNLLELPSDLQVFNNSTFELFSSQSLISPISVNGNSKITLKKRTKSLSKDLMERRLQSNVIESQRKLSHKLDLLKSATKNSGLSHSNVCQTFDAKPDDHNTSTQQLFDSFSDVSSLVSPNLETKNQIQNLGKVFSPVNKLTRNFGNYPTEENQNVLTFQKFAEDLKDLGSIKNCDSTVTSGIIEPVSSVVTSYHSADLFSQSYSHHSCKVLESRQFSRTPDLFSSWSNDTSLMVSNDDHASQNNHDKFDGNLSMPLFSSFEDSG